MYIYIYILSKYDVKLFCNMSSLGLYVERYRSQGTRSGLHSTRPCLKDAIHGIADLCMDHLVAKPGNLLHRKPETLHLIPETPKMPP